ncbi:MAG: hypothetical protein ACK5N0_11190 [Synechococcaceae cyanobacterium]
MNRPDLQVEIDELRTRLERLETESLPTSLNSEEATGCECGANATEPTTKRPDSQSRFHLTGETSYPGIQGSGPAAAAGLLRIRATIDGTRTDNGFLGCVYNAYKKSGNVTVLTHWSTLQARTNISSGPEGFSIIVGHGAPGLIVTGTGQSVDGVAKYIAASNIATWRPILSRGVIGSGLTLFGCEVAAGTAGRNLLRLVANTIRKPVGAWTGLVWCSNNSTVWGTGTFVTVSPGTAMESLIEEAPCMYSEGGEALQVMRLATHGDEQEEVLPDQIVSVQFTPVGNYPVLSDVKAMRAERSDALSVLQRIDLENPFVTEDKPGSIHTGMLTVTYGSSYGDDQRTRTLKVFNSSLVQDAIHTDTYYYASPELQQLLR